MIVAGNALYFTATYDSAVGKALYRFDYSTSIPAAAGIEINLEVSPNPATDLVRIKMGRPITRVEIFDASGRSVFERNLNNSSAATVDLSSLPAGVYNMSVSSGAIAASKQLVLDK